MALKLNPREIDLTRLDHVRELIDEIESDENRRRKVSAWKSFQSYAGNQSEYVKNELQTLYPETFNKFRVGDISIVKKVVDKKGVAYNQTPARKLETEKETKTLNELYAKYKFHRSFKEADTIFNRHKYVFTWVTFQNPQSEEDEFKYVMHALAPYEYDLVRDPITGEPLIFCLNYPDSDITEQAGGSDGVDQTITESQSDFMAETKFYSFWNEKNHVKVKRKRIKGAREDGTQFAIEFVTIPGNERQVNPAGRIPGGFLSSDLAPDYPIASNLAEKSISWNLSFSDLKTAAATQGHGQLVIKRPEGQKMKEVHMGMHTAIDLPQSKKDGDPKTEADYISANPDLGGQLEVLKFDLLSILDEEGIKSKSGIQGDVAKSGFDRLLQEADVQEIIEDNQGLYADNLEQDVYLTIKAYEQALNRNTFSSEKVQVHFEKPKVLISDKETLENLEKRDELGLILPWEKHLIINPNLTPEEAQEREEEIQQAKRERMEAVAGVAPEELRPDPTGPDDLDE